MKYKSTPRKRRLLPIILGLLILAAGAGFLLYDRFNDTANTSTVKTETSGSINLEPPTEEEIKETEDIKRNLPSETKSPSENEQLSSGVTPIITSADQSTVRAYISGISEDGGVCRATFTQGTSTFSKQSSGFRDVSTTVCEPINLERTDFVSSGEWSVTVTYESTLVQGKSQEVKFSVI